jgi:hypothetical protein
MAIKKMPGRGASVDEEGGAKGKPEGLFYSEDVGGSWAHVHEWDGFKRAAGGWRVLGL